MERWKHGVFVNFRGPDVREGFLKNLHKALVRSGIKTFVDSEDLHQGQKLTPALEKAIQRSLVAIVVFSRDYASSEWCLKELVKILECSKLKEQMVITVLNKVKPSQVAHQTGLYEEAMAKHERRHGKDSDMVEKWRHALFIGSVFPGLHLEDNSLVSDTLSLDSVYSSNFPSIFLHRFYAGVHHRGGATTKHGDMDTYLGSAMYSVNIISLI
ncbi:toll/interleukin-1 receptor-like protein [Eucalyptus grandis]|uniref:toll/interleukin-1 receptor-like protein n=1 Tax=Eucalyptus grandis TaxID=71139 RepID=UPI00192F1142|nr:toll/interleukin-1 receptor-like protein [Eucalyptus grandis]